MYIPSSFHVEDSNVVAQFVRDHSFATLVSHDGTTMYASHLPMLLDDRQAPWRLSLHMARANPQWKHLEQCREVLVIFSGPHAYVSPSWYSDPQSVPTWNYTAVHVTGRARLIEDTHQLDQLLNDLIQVYEKDRPEPWIYQPQQETHEQLTQAIVGIEIEAIRVEAKFKLSQNRPQDYDSVANALRSSSHPHDQEVGMLMSQIRDTSMGLARGRIKP
ncbi:MAG: FMN-binding negative transcriptional regulator [Pirellulales bacterium]